MSVSDISNVLIFVSDALRYDALPDEIRKRGVSLKTVAQSTFSAPSFATLATGRYPQEHGVMSFVESIPESLRTVFDLTEFNTSFYQESGDPPIDNPIFDVLRVDENRALDVVEPPFVYMERDMTTHFPHASDETAPSYLASRGTDWDRIRDEYTESVRQSVARFETRIETLAERELLDETLVIVTADHGELLGEYSEIGHKTPLCPELAYVPCVFIHDSISKEDFAIDPKTRTIEHVDVVETVLGYLGAGESIQTSGVDLRGETPLRDFGYCTVTGRVSQLADRHRVSELLQRNLPAYTAEGIFWYDGGFVAQNNSRTKRLFWALHRLGNSAHRYNVRDDISGVLSTYVRGQRTYGDIPVSTNEASRLLQSVASSIKSRDADQVELSSESKERLRELGYVD